MNIIELAKKAGMKVGVNVSGVTLVGSPSGETIAHLTIDELERFAALVLEEAAQVCEERASEHEEDSASEEDADYKERFLVYAKHERRCAKAIRALGVKK